MRSIPRGRRFAVAIAAVFTAALLFRGALASALVTRGDDALHLGDTARGVALYRRALAVDRNSPDAADRLAFLLSLHRGPGDAARAIDIATAALRTHPNDATLLADRALAEQVVHDPLDAERDFSDAASAAADPRYEHFAGRLALGRGDRVAARRHFLRALEDRPDFAPARAALERLR